MSYSKWGGLRAVSRRNLNRYRFWFYSILRQLGTGLGYLNEHGDMFKATEFKRLRRIGWTWELCPQLLSYISTGYQLFGLLDTDHDRLGVYVPGPG